jgi:hypothetical protein
MSTIDLMRTIAGQTSTLHKAEDNKSSDQAAKEAAERAKRAAEEWLKGLEASFKANDHPAPGSITGGKSLSEWNSGRDKRETDFLNTTAMGGTLNQSQLTALLTKRAELEAGGAEAALTQHAKEYDEAIAQLTEIMKQQTEDERKLLDANEKYAAEVEKGTVAAASNLAKSQINAAHLGLADHTMSPHAAALVEQAAHVAEFAAKLLAAHAELATLQKDQRGLTAGTPDFIANATKQLGVNSQIAGLTSDAADTARADSAKTFGASFTGQVDKTFGDIIAKSQDWGTQFKETIEGALGDVNNAIIHILTTKPQAGDHPFKEAGKQIFSGVARTGLQDVEGSLMKGLGMSKIGTSEANPMWVRMAGALKSAGGAVSTAAQAATSGGFWSGLASMLIPRAGGGLLSPGDFYMTGEKGPELLQVGSTSKINNARDTSAMTAGGSGGVTNHAWNIDARGSSDPAAVNAAVQRGIAAAAPHIAAAAMSGAKDRAARRSSSNR